ncbi:hypothetical protein FGO68_gene9191 [Halteria grandinella]|uniref:t-SNARE coiled-coil homology domain-containing protein n=1 Tax=Halteria grandinella TaxID=5974 RepID=A0A8J8NIP0_HALGN|nr:hypothetical protein FGO68_gene9191 [Halteria grandinella]
MENTFDTKLDKASKLLQKLSQKLSRAQRAAQSGDIAGDFDDLKEQSKDLESLVKTILDQDFTLAEKRSPSYLLIRDSLAQLSGKLATLKKSDNPFTINESQQPQAMDYTQQIQLQEVKDDSELDEQIPAHKLRQIANIIETCNEMTKEQLLLIQQHDEQLRLADQRVRDAVEDSRKAGEELREATGHKMKGIKYKVGAFFGGVGAVIGGVLGLGTGAVVGGVGGGIVGTKIGGAVDRSVMKKAKGIQFEEAQ